MRDATDLVKNSSDLQTLEADNFYRCLFEESTDALLVADPDGRIRHTNRRTAELSGYTQSELLGLNLTDLIDAQDMARYPLRWAELKRGDVVRSVRQARRKDGEFFTVENRVRFLSDGRLLVSVREVAAADQQAELALRESEERLRLALSAAKQGLYDLNLETGDATVNDEYALMLEYDPASFRETNAAWIERLHPDDRDSVADAYRRYVAGEIPEYRVEFRQRTRSGGWKWILSLGEILARDEDGIPLRMLGTHTDITARKLTEESLQATDERLRLAIGVADIGFFEHDVINDTVFWSSHLREFYGWSKDEIITKERHLEHVHPDDREYLLAQARQAYDPAGDGVWEIEHRIVRPDGSVRWLTVRSQTFFRGQGAARHAVRTIGAVRDITEQRRVATERRRLHSQFLQAQKMESIGRLAGGVAHDFNNMLGVIQGYAELVLDEVAHDDPVRDQVEEILSAARRSADLTGQLLAFARKQPVSLEVLNLNDAVAPMLTMLQRLIGEHIELTWIPGAGLWPVKVDPSQIDQVLANLCVNARDAIGDVGQITIETTNTSLAAPNCVDMIGFQAGDYVLLTVRDDGCGMSPDVLEHIFEPFFTTKGMGRGTGLGLATVYGIVKQNAGFIYAHSEIDQGTTIRIYLPRDGSAAIVAPTPDAAAPLPPGRGTVLLVEDEPMLLQLGETMLERLGYEVLTADTPTAALRLAAEPNTTIDLLLTDVVLPEMSGQDLACRLRDLRPDLKQIFMSGYTANTVDLREALGEGAVFIQKPFSREELAAKLLETMRI